MPGQPLSRVVCFLGICGGAAGLASAVDSHASVAPGARISVESGLVARALGPAVVGGRISTLAIDPRSSTTFYAGQGMGGLVKTTDGGLTFTDIFAHAAVHSIGDVAVAAADHNVVWLGTGEANDRNTSSWGDGVYRSTDGGTTWNHVGLSDSKTIARIAVDPRNAAVAYVAAMGDLWMPDSARGLYKTNDGGTSWHKVLAAAKPDDVKVGAGDVIIDPSNPDIVYAVLYARQRRPWNFRAGPVYTDGKDVGGIFKSVDAGATWRKLTNGMAAATGRVGLAIFPGNTRIVYAAVESHAWGQPGLQEDGARAGGVFRSDDSGEHWQRTGDYSVFRPSYFSQIRVDPVNDRRVYQLGVGVSVSDDSGRTWRAFAEHTHPDHHAMIIDPANPGHMLLGNDGGVFQSFDGGGSWGFLNRFSAGEVRNVTLDHSDPYRLCIGLQDNDLWVGPSRSPDATGIAEGDWIHAEFGDAGYCVFDAIDPNTLYWTRPGGRLRRVNLKSGIADLLEPQTIEGQPEFRHNWNPPVIGSLHDPDALYYGTNVLIKLTNAGERWKALSPDLTTAPDMAHEGGGVTPYRTISTLAESPAQAGVLWVGTDDGKVWRTTDDGAHWADLTSRLPPAAAGQYINRIEPGHADIDHAYLTVSGFYNGNYTPLVYRTLDGGRSWQSIAGDLPANEPVRVLREDPDSRKVLYLGTEFGLWLTLDGGASWKRFGGLPTVPVEDLQIEPRSHDLVIATQGRGIYVLDQLDFLARITPEVLSEPVHLFPPDVATEEGKLPGRHFEDAFAGENPPAGALLTFYAHEGGPIRIAIKNIKGAPIANLRETAAVGLNRTHWNLKPTADILGMSEVGPPGGFVPTGTYTVTVSNEKGNSVQTLQVRTHPEVQRLYEGAGRTLDPLRARVAPSRDEAEATEEAQE
jgi:photosystem II stability/assembly factor-like uncharacterized protein